MKRFELYEYDKETERLEAEELELDEGLSDVFSAVTKKVWRSLSKTIGRLKFGQTARIPLITANSNLNEGVLLEYGYMGSIYGKYAEMVAAYELLVLLDSKGFRVRKSDITIAKKKMEDSKKKMSEDVKASNKKGPDGKRWGRGKVRDPSSRQLPGKISEKEAREHRLHMKRLHLQGKSLADRTFYEITALPGSLFAEYRTEWSKAKVRRTFGRVSAYQDGASHDTKADTADLIVEKYSKDKVEKEAKETIGFSLKTHQHEKEGADRGVSTTGGPGFYVWNILSRALAYDVKEIDISKARAMPGLLNDAEQTELIFKHYGIKFSDHTERFRKINKDVKAWNAENPNNQKKWYEEYEKLAEGEIIDNWMDVWTAAGKNPKLKNAMVQSLRKSLDIAYKGKSGQQSATLLSSHWYKKTNQIKTFSNMDAELRELFTIKDEDLDFEFIRLSDKKIAVKFIYNGNKKLEFWRGDITIFQGGRGFEGVSANEQTHKETIKIDFDKGSYRTKIKEEAAEIETMQVNAYYSMKKYIESKGWGTSAVSNTGKKKSTRSGYLPTLADIQKVLPNIKEGEYGFKSNNELFNQLVNDVAGLSTPDSTPIPPEQVFRPYAQILSAYAKAAKGVEEQYTPHIESFAEYDKETERLEESVDKKTFMDAMRKLHASGDDEMIDRAFGMMADVMVEREISDIFDVKAPKAAATEREKVALEIKKLKISPDEKVELVKGINSGEAFQIHKALRKTKKKISLNSIVGPYKGAKELLPWFVKYKGSPDSGKRGAASSELWMIVCGKKGRTPDKGDAIVGSKAVEIKSYGSSYTYEYTVSGKQHNGKLVRDPWVAEATKLYKQKGLYKDYWQKYEREQGWAMPFGNSPGKKPGVKTAYMQGPMNSFCYNLQKHGGMTKAQINNWLNTTTAKVMKSTNYRVKDIWNGNRFDRDKFLLLWSACGLDYYMKEEGFDQLAIINQSDMGMVVLNSGADMLALGNKVRVAGVAMNAMPGQNQSVSEGHIKF